MHRVTRRSPSVTAVVEANIINKTLHDKPTAATHWSRHALLYCHSPAREQKDRAMLAYHFVHSLRLRLKEQGIDDSWETLRETLATQRRVTATLQRRDGRTVQVRNATRPEPHHQRINQILRLPPQSRRHSSRARLARSRRGTDSARAALHKSSAIHAEISL